MPARKLAETWAALTARDIMRTQLITVSTTTPLADVVRLLGEYRVGGLPVTNEAGRIVGVVSMRDLIERYAQDPDQHPRRRESFYGAPDASLDTLDDDEAIEPVEFEAEADETAGDLMNSEVWSVPASADLQQIATVMVERHIHRVLVLEKERHVGLITTLDVLRALARDPASGKSS